MQSKLQTEWAFQLQTALMRKGSKTLATRAVQSGSCVFEPLKGWQCRFDVKAYGSNPQTFFWHQPKEKDTQGKYRMKTAGRDGGGRWSGKEGGRGCFFVYTNCRWRGLLLSPGSYARFVSAWRAALSPALHSRLATTATVPYSAVRLSLNGI